MSLTRRAAFAAGLAAAAPAWAAPPAKDLRTAPEVQIVIAARDEAPPASDIDAWSAYEARLRARLADAGGGHFDVAGARAVLPLANQARAAAGAPPLVWHEELAETAKAHGGDMAARGDVNHLTPEGFDPSHRFWLLARTTVGSPSENLAYHRQPGPPATPAQLLSQWKRSTTGHWQNLLRPSHTHAAFALVRGPDRALLVGLFCRPLATLAQPLPFQAHGVDIAQALRNLPTDLDPRLGPPQGARRGPVVGRQMGQISLLRRDAPGGPEYVGGPVFLPTR